MKPFPIVSPSAIAEFEQCPKKWHETKILKNYKFEVTEVIHHGNVVHEALERYTKYKTPLPEHLEPVSYLIDGLRDMGYTLYAELEMCVDHDWRPLTYWDETGTGMLRGKIDLCAIRGTEAVIIDYKTGKRKKEFFQLDVYAAVLMTVLQLTKIESVFCWLKTNETDKKILDAATIEPVRTDITDRIKRMRDLYERQELPARPSPLCPWCPVINDCKEAIYYKVKSDRTRR